MRQRHFHARREIAIWYPPPPPERTAAMSIALQQTVVLRKCSCGDLDTVVLHGKWTLEQVRGGTPAAAPKIPALL